MKPWPDEPPPCRFVFDGPDEVHFRTIAKAELGREPSAMAAAVTRG